jgi:hypothetical protein
VTRNRHIARISKDGSVARIRYNRGAREAIATIVKVAGIRTSNIKAEELDSPLARVW